MASVNKMILLGALGAAGLARCVNLVRGTERSYVAWNAEALHEMRQFPGSMYKDQVDAASSAFNAVAPKRQKKTGLFATGDHVGNKARPF